MRKVFISKNKILFPKESIVYFNSGLTCSAFPSTALSPLIPCKYITAAC